MYDTRSDLVTLIVNYAVFPTFVPLCERSEDRNVYTRIELPSTPLNSRHSGNVNLCNLPGLTTIFAHKTREGSSLTSRQSLSEVWIRLGQNDNGVKILLLGDGRCATTIAFGSGSPSRHSSGGIAEMAECSTGEIVCDSLSPVTARGVEFVVDEDLVGTRNWGGRTIVLTEGAEERGANTPLTLFSTAPRFIYQLVYSYIA